MKGFVPPPRMSMLHRAGADYAHITVTEGVSVKDLAEKLDVRGKDLIARLLMRGVFVTVNQSLDAELVKDIAAIWRRAPRSSASKRRWRTRPSKRSRRRPDRLVKCRVLLWSPSWATSITARPRCSMPFARPTLPQAKPAASPSTSAPTRLRFSKEGSPALGREIVFLDTPGHEAFTRMRARGAKVTDIVVIVVAADDGVMPQTLEAIDHAKAANVPIIVAVNKIDKPDAHPDRVKQQLADRGLVPEDWGGSTVFVDVSAKKKTNLDLLLEMICLVADLQDLKATPERKASGTVLEAKLDRGRGAVATVLVQNGTLHAGDSFIVGNTFGKVRAMFDDRGVAMQAATPSTPVEVLGLEGMPDAGDHLVAVVDRDKAGDISEYRKMKEREAQLAKSSRVSLEGLAEQIKQAGVKDLPIILKGDVGGSVEVLADFLGKMSNEEGEDQGHSHRRRCHHGERHSAGVGVQCDRHRLRRSPRTQGAGTGRAGRRGDSPALDHLRVAGRNEEGHDGPA